MQPIRQIRVLRSATALLEKPPSIPESRPKGAAAAGLRFEKAVHEALSGGIRGQWFSYQDAEGSGYCQTDIIYPFLPHFFAVIEVKYTLTPGAFQKLQSLYLPVAAKALKAPCAGVVVVKNLDPRFRRGKVYTELTAAAEASFDSGHPTLLQWSGQALIRKPLPTFAISPTPRGAVA